MPIYGFKTRQRPRQGNKIERVALNKGNVFWEFFILNISTSTFPVMHLICPPHPPPPLPVIQERNEKQRLCKILGDKRGALWEMWKWRIGRVPAPTPIPRI